MDVLFHFIFTLFKIAILASLYATVVWLTVYLTGKINPDSWFGRVPKAKLWLRSGLIVSLFLFVNLFSYWGDHGLGDNARIPIGHGKSVGQINGAQTYITPSGYDHEMLEIKKYAVTDSFLFAKAPRDTWEQRGEVIVWDLQTDEVAFLKYSSEIDSYKAKNKIDEPLEFLDFAGHYSNYWSG
ncbi:hypothetical protein [Spirosoma gilvum]